MICAPSNYNSRCVYSRTAKCTFLSQHDPVGLTPSIPRLQRQVVECESKPGGRAVDLKATETVAVGWVDVGVVWGDEVTRLDSAGRPIVTHLRHLTACSVAISIDHWATIGLLVLSL